MSNRENDQTKVFVFNTMKIRIFKTFTKDLGYFTINFLPVVTLEWFKGGQGCLFIGWLTLGFQINWE